MRPAAGSENEQGSPAGKRALPALLMGSIGHTRYPARISSVDGVSVRLIAAAHLTWIKVVGPETRSDCLLCMRGGAMLVPDSTRGYPTFFAVIAAFRSWLRERRLIRLCRQGLDACDRDEVAHIARDVGLSPVDLRQMADIGSDAAKQLLDRMDALHMDADALGRSDQATVRDLQRLCSACAEKKSCQRDLMLTTDDPGWRQYCPNVDTLDMLQGEARKRTQSPPLAKFHRAAWPR